MARVATLALALVCLAGQLSTVVHLAVVQHTTCEHGELVEAPLAVTVAQPGDPGVSAPDDAAPPHSHDHCVLNTSRRDGPRLARVSAPLATLEVALPRLCADAPPPASIPLIFVAPKSSPPA